MSNFCCDKLQNVFEYVDSHFSMTESGKTYLLNAGYNNVTYDKLKRLAEATFIDDPDILKKMPDYPLDKKIRAPMVVQINYCPFCSKKLSQ